LQTATWASSLDRLGKPLGDDDVALAIGAGVLGADVLDHDERRGDIFELLAGLLADAGALGAAVGTGAPLRRDVVDDPLARQARRQRLAAVALAGGLASRRRRGRLGLGGRCGSGLGLSLLDDLTGEEEELIRVDPLGLLAVELAEELLELVLELVVEVDLLRQRLEQLADELMGSVEVGWEWVVDGDHTPYYV
jgi:hypothetical protein